MRQQQTLLTALLGLGLLLMLPVSSPAHQAPDRIAPPVGAHVTRAWIPDDGPALVAWESTEEGRSGVVLYRDGEMAREWDFADVLVKDVRWLEPGETLRLGVVTTEGRSETRVFSLESGRLVPIGSTSDLEPAWDGVSLSADGTRWVAVRYGDGAATVVVGALGSEEPSVSWQLKPGDPVPDDPGVIEELNRVAFVEGPGGGEAVVVLWNGRLWLADAVLERHVQLSPPGDCTSVQTFHEVSGGLWVQCHRGLGKDPAGLWGYYPATVPAGNDRPAARTLAAFRNPWFRDARTVLDLDRRRGRADVARLTPGAPEPTPLGTFALPTPGARYVPAGDALLEAIEGTDQYHVLPIASRIAALETQPEP